MYSVTNTNLWYVFVMLVQVIITIIVLFISVPITLLCAVLVWPFIPKQPPASCLVFTEWFAWRPVLCFELNDGTFKNMFNGFYFLTTVERRAQLGIPFCDYRRVKKPEKSDEFH